MTIAALIELAMGRPAMCKWRLDQVMGRRE